MESRITDLEIKQSFQDDLLESLNRTVAEQQRQIDLLQEQVRLLYTQIKSLSPTHLAEPGDEPPPPHY